MLKTCIHKSILEGGKRIHLIQFQIYELMFFKFITVLKLLQD